MKIQVQKSRRQQGTVLFVSLAICAILGILIGSYLYLIQNQRLSVSRGQSWENALTVAEAGVEEAMAHLNSGIGTNSFGTNSWTDLGGGNYAKTNYLGSNYWAVTISTSPAVTNVYPVILSTGYVPGPISGPMLSRSIQVMTKAKTAGGFGGGAITAKGTITLAGSGVTVDSFNSSDPNYSTGGLYDPAKAEAHGDVTSISTSTNAMSIAESKVYGSTHTAPGVQTYVDTSKNGTGSVGDLAWVSGGNVGIETGHSAQDASYTFTDVTLPSLPWLVPVAAKGGNQLKTNGISFPYVLGNISPWEIDDLSSSLYITDPNVVIYVPNSLSLGSGTEIYIAPGASLTMYVGAASASIGGQGIVNANGVAKDFVYEGLPSNTSLGLQGNASFTGQFYAPEADITLGGGGTTPEDFAGQIVGNTFKMNGHFNVHYDEALTASATVFAGYVATLWNEL
jgi:hypothetical protein